MYEKLNPKYSFLAGCDEVGRGPLAGPVVAATVYLQYEKGSARAVSSYFKELRKLGVTDSKKLSSKKREEILNDLEIDFRQSKNTFVISKNYSLSYKVTEISPTKIDKINILHASLLGMESSFLDLHNEELKGKLLVDGNRAPSGIPESVEVETVVKGDSKSLLIGLASIIAKEYRDQLMKRMAKKYPEFGFERHAGYPTAQHKEAIQNYGVTPIHRKTFKGVKEFL